MKKNIKCKKQSKGILTYPVMLFLITILFLYSGGLSFVKAQTINSWSDSTYMVDQLKEDFTILRNALEEGHSGLYRYTSKDEFDKLFEKMNQSLTEPMTEIEFYVKLYPLITKIRCGHTRIGLSRPTTTTINKSPITIPFSFEFIGNKTYLLRNYSELENLAMGGEVISINGKSIASILREMLSYISSDAHILSYKYQYIKRLNHFSRIYAWLYGQSDSFSIVYKSPSSNKEETLEVKGLDRETMMSIAEERYPEVYVESPPIEIRYENNIPVLDIDTFEPGVYEEPNLSFGNQIAAAFKHFRENGDKNLIIDLRNNDGGEGDYGRVLATYLFDGPFNYYKSLEFKSKEYSFFENTNSSQELWDELAKEGELNSRGWYDYTIDPGLGIQKNNDLFFKGNVYILFNGNSFSTTGEFISAIHFNKRAKFVGTEECGGGYYGNQSGFLPVVSFPNTKIRMSLPLIRYNMAVDNYPKERGLIPDYLISPDIMDLVNGIDTEMEYLIKLIDD